MSSFNVDLDLKGLDIHDLNVQNSNFSIKNSLIIKDDISSIPLAGEDYLDVVFYYIGESTENFEKFGIYRCIKDNDTYKWQLSSNMVRSGVSEPANTLGINGDYYIYYSSVDNVNSLKNFYIKSSDSWVKIIPSSSSMTTYEGTTSPASSLGNEGDLYFLYENNNYVKFTGDNNFTFYTNMPTSIATIEYSLDGSTWQTYTASTTITTTNKYLLLRGKGNSRITNSSSNTFQFNGDATKIAIEGSLMYLLDYESSSLPTMGSMCFAYMFYNQTKITSIGEGFLPATSLSIGCYYYMFYGCSNLSSLPDNLLPAETLVDQCYASMFQNCSSLKVNTTSGKKILTYHKVSTTDTIAMFSGTSGSFQDDFLTEGVTYYNG